MLKKNQHKKLATFVQQLCSRYSFFSSKNTPLKKYLTLLLHDFSQMFYFLSFRTVRRQWSALIFLSWLCSAMIDIPLLACLNRKICG